MATDDEVKERIKNILVERRGEDEAITSREINEEVGLDNIGSFPSTRAVIRDIVMEDEVPIAATTNGYFLIESEDELDNYVQNLENRVMNITERKFAILKAVDEWFHDLDDEDDDLL